MCALWKHFLRKEPRFPAEFRATPRRRPMTSLFFVHPLVLSPAPVMAMPRSGMVSLAGLSGGVSRVSPHIPSGGTFPRVQRTMKSSKKHRPNTSIRQTRQSGPNELGPKRIRSRQKCSWDGAFVVHGGGGGVRTTTGGCPRATRPGMDATSVASRKPSISPISPISPRAPQPIPQPPAQSHPSALSPSKTFPLLYPHHAGQQTTALPRLSVSAPLVRRGRTEVCSRMPPGAGLRLKGVL